MRLVLLKGRKDKPIYINPNHVLSLMPYGEDKTIITMISNSIKVVHEKHEVVVRKLTSLQELDSY